MKLSKLNLFKNPEFNKSKNTLIKLGLCQVTFRRSKDNLIKTFFLGIIGILRIWYKATIVKLIKIMISTIWKNRPPIVWERGIFNSLLFLKLYIYIHTPALKAQIKTLFHLIFIPSSNNKIALANEAFKNNDLPVKFWLIQVSLDNILILLLIGLQNLLWPILCLYLQMRWC